MVCLDSTRVWLLTWSPPHSPQSSDAIRLHTNLGPLLACCRLTGLAALDDGGVTAGKSRQWLYTPLAPPIFCLFLFRLLSQSRLIFSPLSPRKGIFPAEVRGLVSTGRHTDHDKESPKTGQESPILWPPDAKDQLLGKKPWFWERLKVGGEGDDRGWDGWMASLTRWAWVWAGSRWWTGRPGMLQSMGLQRVGHDWATELNWSYRKLE